MSRLAKRPIAIPAKTEVTVSGGTVNVKGPKGSLQRPLHRLVTIEVGKDGVQVLPKGESLQSRALGFSHPVKVAIPEGLTVKADKGALDISGFDKELVGQFAADIRAMKKPEPYKVKGIRYDGEVIRRKQGKKAA